MQQVLHIAAFFTIISSNTFYDENFLKLVVLCHDHVCCTVI